MIKVLIVVLGFAVFLSAREEQPAFSKITRVNCSASSTGPCANVFCYVKLVNRYKSLASGGCETLSRPVTKAFGEFKLSYKRLGNYYQIIDVKAMELCAFFSRFLGKEYNPLFAWLMISFPGKVHLCPYKDKDFQVINITTGPGTEAAGPDGFYKASISIKDEKGDNMFSTVFVIQISNKHNIVGFK